MINSALDSMTLDFNARERLRQRKGEAREILNSIQVLPSAQQWHTDEPSESGDYLCYLFDDFDKECWFEVCSYYDTDGTAEGDYAGWRSGGIVLAWMPLPKPYEVKNN